MSIRKTSNRLIFLTAGFSTLVPERALAHLVNTDVGEFYAGMLHPLTSAEHLLPTLALALLASQLGQRAARGVLLLFPVTLAAGITIGNQFPHIAFIQTINFLLLVALGALLMFAGRLPPLVAPVLAVLTGLILGYRSGVDMAAAAVGMQFLPGVALTGLILMALFVAWVPGATSERAQIVRSFVGAGFSIAGLTLILSPFAGLGPNTRGVGIPGQEDIVGMVKRRDLNLSVMVAALTGSLIWGAGHALTPGHGKAIVAAYLVGARSTPWHAVYLGLTVTATHTLVVFALGLMTLFASHYILADQLYPWLALVSGLIIVAMGAGMATARIQRLRRGDGHVHRRIAGHVGSHDHEKGCPSDAGHSHTHDHADIGNARHGDHRHDHSHGHGHSNNPHGHSHLPPGAEGTPVTWRSLLGLGISGGLLPCPAALVLLLAAVSLGRVGFGLVLVTVFSLGLAAVLVGVGLLFIKGGQLLARVPHLTSLGRWLPAFSALAIFAIGVVITLQAAARI
jgi:ABC-type nickel/cobalt efflux system permease component RcnA/hydrogenase/urease accessory protein HupE